jgi:hypothetical protein
MLKVPNTFSVCTNHRGFLMQTFPEDDVKAHLRTYLYHLFLDPRLALRNQSFVGRPNAFETGSTTRRRTTKTS